MSGNWFRFIIIAGCFALSLTYKEYAYSTEDAYSLRLALFLTVCGDFFLILTNRFILGILLFCTVQLIYVYRYVGTAPALLAGLALPFIFVLGKSLLPALERIAFIYAFCLLSSVTASFFSKLPYPNKTASELAMLSFLLCDLNVAIYNMETFSHSRKQFFFLIWLFYFPSQIILALSAKAFKSRPLP